MLLSLPSQEKKSQESRGGGGGPLMLIFDEAFFPTAAKLCWSGSFTTHWRDSFPEDHDKNPMEPGLPLVV